MVTIYLFNPTQKIVNMIEIIDTHVPSFFIGDTLEHFAYEGCHKKDCVKVRVLKYLGFGDYLCTPIGQSRGGAKSKINYSTLKHWVE